MSINNNEEIESVSFRINNSAEIIKNLYLKEVDRHTEALMQIYLKHISAHNENLAYINKVIENAHNENLAYINKVIESENVKMSSIEESYIIKRIISFVEKITGISKEDISSLSRLRMIVTARHFLGYALYKYTGMSYNQVGETIRPKYNHSCVINSIKMVNNDVFTKSDPIYSWHKSLLLNINIDMIK